MLRKHVESESGFHNQLAKIEVAIANKCSFECLNNGHITRDILQTCLSEIRSTCEFPIRPDPQDLEMEPSLTAFGKALEMFAARDRHVDPNIVAHEMVFAKVKDQVLSLFQVG